MSEDEKKKAREFIIAGKNLEAREMLEPLKNYDPDARQFLKTMEEIASEETSRSKKIAVTPHYSPVMTRWTINILVLAICFIITRSLVPGIIYWIYDWRFNRKEKLDTNMIIVGIIASLGIYFGLSVLLALV